MKTKKTSLITGTCLLIGLVLFFGCKAPAPLVVTPVNPGIYGFKPAFNHEKNNIPIALILPASPPTQLFGQSKMIRDFSAHMSEDMQQLISSCGYFFRGPFETVSSMVYNDKQSCFLYLYPEININVDYSNLHARMVRVVANGQYVYNKYFEGEVTLSGRITLIFGETFTKEKIQAFSIPLQSQNVEIKSIYHYPQATDFRTPLIGSPGFKPDPGIINPIVAVLQEYYTTSFKTIQDQLDKKQVQLYLSDAEKVRKDANYFKQ